MVILQFTLAFNTIVKSFQNNNRIHNNQPNNVSKSSKIKVQIIFLYTYLITPIAIHRYLHLPCILHDVCHAQGCTQKKDEMQNKWQQFLSFPISLMTKRHIFAIQHFSRRLEYIPATIITQEMLKPQQHSTGCVVQSQSSSNIEESRRIHTEQLTSYDARFRVGLLFLKRKDVGCVLATCSWAHNSSPVLITSRNQP